MSGTLEVTLPIDGAGSCRTSVRRQPGSLVPSDFLVRPPLRTRGRRRLGHGYVDGCDRCEACNVTSACESLGALLELVVRAIATDEEPLA
jgi:hypothetical protein